MKEIQAKTHSVRELLSDTKYGNFDDRFSLYKGIAEQLWSADHLKKEV